MKGFLRVFLISSFAVGCATKSLLKSPAEYSNAACERTFAPSLAAEPEKQLDIISDLFAQSCFKEVIKLGTFIRDQRRDKVYEITAEVAEVVTPEGTFTDYVLESYERSYLSLLLAVSYFGLKQESSGFVELRRSLEEEQAYIYNYGSDPVILALQASIWDRHDSSISRPLWKGLSENPQVQKELRTFARARIREIDQNPSQLIKWRVSGIGYMPRLDWQTDFIKQRSGPYLITPERWFPVACSSRDSVIVPTSTWADKVAARYQSDYHPILFARSLARVPFGLGYGVLGVSAGVAVGFGGCAAAASAKTGGDQLCSTSLQAASYIVRKSANLVEYTMKPDLRHWSRVPMGFEITRVNPGEDLAPCLNQYPFRATTAVLLE